LSAPVIILVVVTTVAVAELALRVLEPALPTHRLWHDTLPAVRVRQMKAFRKRWGRADVVFCGSSVVHSGIAPRAVAEGAGLPLRGYNAALHRGFYAVIGPWLTGTVIPMLRPRILVLGISIYDSNDNGPLLVEEPEKYRRSLLGRDGLVGAVARRLAMASALFRHHRVLIRPRVLLAAARCRAEGTVLPDADVRGSKVSVGDDGEWVGFHGRGFHTTEAMHDHLANGVLGNFCMGGEQLAIVERTVAALRPLVAQLVLTTVPMSRAITELLPNGRADLDDALVAIRAIAERAGVPLIEVDLDLEDEVHFADPAHVNEKGMDRFSRRLGVRLAEVLSGSTPTASRPSR